MPQTHAIAAIRLDGTASVVVKGCMDHAIKILTDQKSLISQEMEDLQERLKELRISLRSIEDAIQTLGGSQTVVVSSKSLKELIEGLVSTQDEGLTPKEVSDILSRGGRATSQQSVSSTLSRLKAEGVVESTSTGKWVAKKKEAPPLGRSGAFDLGPRDGSRDRLSTDSPEGSIPSGSTALHRSTADDEDEIPF